MGRALTRLSHTETGTAEVSGPEQDPSHGTSGCGLLPQETLLICAPHAGVLAGVRGRYMCSGQKVVLFSVPNTTGLSDSRSSSMSSLSVTVTRSIPRAEP